mgnify:CR=1 FL=1|tara:strand:- start:92 stop:1348 length:1257 start_codon:yes stop_codon:yes gene_type:complete
MYLISERFDLMAKLLYIKNYEKEINSKFYIDLYKQHINVFNKNWEHPGTKTNILEFISEFNKLIQSFKKNGFDNKYPIQMGKNTVIINGSHRLMLSYYYNIKPNIIFKENNGHTYNYDFFLQRNNYWRRNNETYNNLKQIYADTMALEYIKNNKNVRCMITYPIAHKYNKISNIVKVIEEYGYLYYKKELKLTKNGVINFIKELYRGESWIGGMFPNDSCGGKLDLCYSEDPITLFLIDFKDINKIVECKEKCRTFFNLNKHSLHMSDYQKDTFRIASCLCNKNSLDFLNYGTNNISQNTKNSLVAYFNNLKQNNNDYVLTSSLILEMFGLRNAKDLDYIHKKDCKLQLKNTGVHSGIWLTYYSEPKNELLYNPNHYFYFNGFKFASLEMIKCMKQKRNEKKDKRDVKLMKKLPFMFV